MHANIKSPYKQYMEGVLRYPLLTKEEEFELGNTIQAGLKEDATEEEKERWSKIWTSKNKSIIRIFMWLFKIFPMFKFLTT